MLNQIVNRLQGQVRIRVETPFPERVLNLCGARNLAFWDMAVSYTHLTLPTKAEV